MTSDRVIGICSLCRGRVVVPFLWAGTTPPVPKCERCGAISAQHALPVIPMQKLGEAS